MRESSSVTHFGLYRSKMLLVAIVSARIASPVTTDRFVVSASRTKIIALADPVMSLSPSFEDQILVGTPDSLLSLDPETGRSRKIVSGLESSINGLSAVEGDKVLLSGGLGVDEASLLTGRLRPILDTRRFESTRSFVSPDRRWLAVLNDENGSMTVYRNRGSEPPLSWLTVKGPRRVDTAVALGNRRLAVGTEFDLRIADLVRRTSRSVSLNHTVDALAWGLNEDWIFAIGATDVSIVDPSSAKKRSQVRASVPDDPILRAVYSPRAGGIWLDSQEALRFLPDGARAAYIAGKSGTRPDVIVESRKGNRLAVASGRTISLYNVTKRRAPSVSQNTAAR